MFFARRSAVEGEVETNSREGVCAKPVDTPLPGDFPFPSHIFIRWGTAVLVVRPAAVQPRTRLPSVFGKGGRSMCVGSAGALRASVSTRFCAASTRCLSRTALPSFLVVLTRGISAHR